VDPEAEAEEHTTAEERMMRRCYCKATEQSLHFRWTVAFACAWYGWTHDQRTPRLVLAKLQRDEGSNKEIVTRFMWQVWPSNTSATDTKFASSGQSSIVVFAAGHFLKVSLPKDTFLCCN
jgi:hypothetical protein